MSTTQRLAHCDPSVYTGTAGTILYKIVDALCGTTGAGALINEILLARMAGAMETLYFHDLDYIFGQIGFLSRSPAESYPYNPTVDLLTSDQWDEVRVKDAWYRDRVKQYFIACSQGGTPTGIRTCVNAAIAVDCDLFEIWRYTDNWGLGANLGRAPVSARNEIVVKPHKETLEPIEMRLLRDMLDRMSPIDAIITVDTQGLAVQTPVPVATATADSTYFQVERLVTATPVLAQMPPPQLLPIDLLPSEQWLFRAQTTPQVAPTAAFNATQEYSQYYLYGDPRSQIDAVTYGTLQPDGTVKTEQNYSVYQTFEQYTEWKTYELCDCPGNFPGGKYGIHPAQAPALNPDGTPYHFAWDSQLEWITHEIERILGIGGIADAFHYKLPVSAPSQVMFTFYPDYAVATTAPARDSTVSTSLTRRRQRPNTFNLRDPHIFVR